MGRRRLRLLLQLSAEGRNHAQPRRLGVRDPDRGPRAVVRGQAAAGHGPLDRPVGPGVQGRDEGHAQRRRAGQARPTRPQHRPTRLRCRRPRPRRRPPSRAPSRAGWRARRAPVRDPVSPGSKPARGAQTLPAPGQAPSEEPRRHDAAHRAPLRAAQPVDHLADRDRGHHGVRLHLVRDGAVRLAQPRRAAQDPVLLAARLLPRGVHRGRLVHAAGHRRLRPVLAAAQGGCHGRGGAGLPGVAVRDLGASSPPGCTRGSAGTRSASSRWPRCCSWPGRCWPSS